MKTNPVKSRFAVPAAIALAGHAILLFGFRSHPPTGAVPATEKTGPISDPVPVDFASPKPKTEEQNDQPYSPKTEAGPISTPEPPASLIPVGAQTFTPSALDLQSVKYDTKVVPAGPFGPGPNLGDPNGVILISAAQLDSTPRVKFQARPLYPYSMRQSGIAGEVVVDFLVDEQGNVSDVRVVRSTHRDFEDATVRAVSQWKFEPGKRHGRVVRFRMAQPIDFSIGE